MPDWDAKYAAADNPFGAAPNEYVRRMATHPAFPGGPVLCLADGDGRNGSWLAARGLEVTALDLSEVGTGKAVARDRAAGVSVERLVADLADWTPPAGRSWGAVFLIYLQSEPEVRARALRLAADVLAPGGWLVLEAFARTKGAPTGLAPKDEAVLYHLAEIIGQVPGLEVLEALEGRVLLDEGIRHRGEADIIRFAARKPLSQE